MPFRVPYGILDDPDHRDTVGIMARNDNPLNGLRIHIVEDHAMFREMVEYVLTHEHRCKVVGRSQDAEDAIPAILEQAPDIVLLDLSLGDSDGFRVVDAVRAKNRVIRFIAVSSRCDEYTQFRIEQVGNCGFIDKNSQGVSLLGEAMRRTMEGGLFFSPAFLETRRRRLADSKSFTKLLSDREIQVLEQIAGSLSDDEIGERLGLSASTVQTHRSNIIRRLGIGSTPKLIQYALSCGFSHKPPAPVPMSAAPSRRRTH